jgi:hypothetical protein
VFDLSAHFSRRRIQFQAFPTSLESRSHWASL